MTMMMNVDNVHAVHDTAPPVDQLRALSLNRLDGMQRSSSFVADLPFKCPSYPRLGERQLSSSTALDELSLSPRLSSNANLSQDLDAADLTGSVSEMSPRQPGVSLTRSVSVRTTTVRPLAVPSIHLLAPVAAAVPGNKSSSRRQAELTSEQRLPFPECPVVSGSAVRRSMSCPLMVTSDVNGIEARALAVNRQAGSCEPNDRSQNQQLLTTDTATTCRRRRRSSAFERDVDLRGEVVADLPVALRAQFPDFEPESLIGSNEPLKSTVSDRKLPPPRVVADALSTTAVGAAVGQGHRYAANDTRLLLPTSMATRYVTSGCFTPPMSRCDIQVKCLRWLRDTERHEQK